MAFAPLFIWIGVIFYLSSSSGSMTETSRFIRPLLEFLFPSASEEILISYHFYIRKLAHITVYAVLGFFAVRAFLNMFSLSRWKLAFATSLLTVLLVAVTDEINQSFISSRTSSAGDVLLDCLGGTLAIGFYVSVVSYLTKPTKANLRSNP